MSGTTSSGDLADGHADLRRRNLNPCVAMGVLGRDVPKITKPPFG